MNFFENFGDFWAVAEAWALDPSLGAKKTQKNLKKSGKSVPNRLENWAIFLTLGKTQMRPFGFLVLFVPL